MKCQTDASMLMLRSDAVVLDLDGLLIDSETACYETANAILGRFGCQLEPEAFAAFVGISVREFYGWLAERFSLPVAVDELIAQRSRIITKRYARPVLMPGATELLRQLADIGIPVALASSSPAPLVMSALEGAGLRSMVQVVVADGHPAVTRLKPAPDLYLVACRVLGVQTQAACAVEDSATGAKAALTAGLTTVVVPNKWTSNADFPPGVLRASSLTAISFQPLPR